MPLGVVDLVVPCVFGVLGVVSIGVPGEFLLGITIGSMLSVFTQFHLSLFLNPNQVSAFYLTKKFSLKQNLDLDLDLEIELELDLDLDLDLNFTQTSYYLCCKLNQFLVLKELV